MKKILFLIAAVLSWHSALFAPIVPTDLTDWYTELRTIICTEVNDSNIARVAELAQNLADAAVAGGVFNEWVVSQANQYIIENWLDGGARRGPLVADLYHVLRNSQPIVVICETNPAILTNLTTLFDYVIRASSTQVDARVTNELAQEEWTTGEHGVLGVVERMPWKFEGCADCINFFMGLARLIVSASNQKSALCSLIEGLPVLQRDEGQTRFNEIDNLLKA